MHDDKTRSVRPILRSRRDAAFELGISLRLLDALLASSELLSRRIRGRRLIPQSEIERYARADNRRTRRPSTPRKVWPVDHSIEDATPRTESDATPDSEEQDGK